MAWLIGWFAEAPLSDWLAFSVFGLERGSHFGEAIAFFLLDVPKVLLLLIGIITVVTLIRGFFPPEKVRAALAGRGLIGFVEAGIPLGVTFAFLISSPMVNEVALVLLWGLFGPAIALVYMAAGLTVAMIGGLVIGKLHMERYVEDNVWALQGKGGAAIEVHLTWEDRIHDVLLAVPMYSNAAGTIPIVQALLGKGLPLGTTLSFMMAVTAISLPELIILRRVIKLPLLAVFVGVVTTGILAIGYLFNFLIV